MPSSLLPDHRRQINKQNERMKKTLIAVVAAVAMTGCMNGRSGSGQLTRSQLHFGETAKSKNLDIDSHKDVTVDKLKRTAPDGTTIEIEGYKSRANEAAIVAATKQAESAAKVSDNTVEMLKLFGGYAMQWASGGVAKPQPQVIVVTNYVAVPATNSPAK